MITKENNQKMNCNKKVPNSLKDTKIVPEIIKYQKFVKIEPKKETIF